VPKNLLVASPHSAFGELLRSSLEESGKYRVWLARSAREALDHARNESIDLAILDADLKDQPLPQIGKALLDLHPDMYLMVIPPENDPSLLSVVNFSAHSYLTRPFYMPDLLDRLEALLSPRAVVTSMLTPASPPPATGPSWKDDPESALQAISNRLFEVMARAVLVLSNGNSAVSVGEFSQADTDRITGIANRHRVKAPSADIVRYVRLGQSSVVLVYMRPIGERWLLAAVYDEKVTISQGRTCTNKLLELLNEVNQPTDVLELVTPVIEEPAPEQQPGTQIELVEPPAVTPEQPPVMEFPLPEEVAALETTQPAEDWMDIPELRDVTTEDLLGEDFRAAWQEASDTDESPAGTPPPTAAGVDDQPPLETPLEEPPLEIQDSPAAIAPQPLQEDTLPVEATDNLAAPVPEQLPPYQPRELLLEAFDTPSINPHPEELPADAEPGAEAETTPGTDVFSPVTEPGIEALEVEIEEPAHGEPQAPGQDSPAAVLPVMDETLDEMDTPAPPDWVLEQDQVMVPEEELLEFPAELEAELQSIRAALELDETPDEPLDLRETFASDIASDTGSDTVSDTGSDTDTGSDQTLDIPGWFTAEDEMTGAVEPPGPPGWITEAEAEADAAQNAAEQMAAARPTVAEGDSAATDFELDEDFQADPLEEEVSMDSLPMSLTDLLAEMPSPNPEAAQPAEGWLDVNGQTHAAQPGMVVFPWEEHPQPEEPPAPQPSEMVEEQPPTAQAQAAETPSPVEPASGQAVDVPAWITELAPELDDPVMEQSIQAETRDANEVPAWISELAPEIESTGTEAPAAVETPAVDESEAPAWISELAQEVDSPVVEDTETSQPVANDALETGAGETIHTGEEELLPPSFMNALDEAMQEASRDDLPEPDGMGIQAADAAAASPDLGLPWELEQTRPILTPSEPPQGNGTAPPTHDRSTSDPTVRITLDRGSETLRPPAGGEGGLPSTTLVYTCILIPRRAEHTLTGTLAQMLEQWLPQNCVAFGWFLEDLKIEPDYLQWAVRVTPSVSPGNLIRIIRQRTSESILQTFPALSIGEAVAPGASPVDFWAPGYLVLRGSQSPTANQLQEFIAQTRRRQGSQRG